MSGFVHLANICLLNLRSRYIIISGVEFDPPVAVSPHWLEMEGFGSWLFKRRAGCGLGCVDVVGFAKFEEVLFLSNLEIGVNANCP